METSNINLSEENIWKCSKSLPLNGCSSRSYKNFNILISKFSYYGSPEVVAAQTLKTHFQLVWEEHRELCPVFGILNFLDASI